VNLKLTVRPFALPDEITWPVELNTYGGSAALPALTSPRNLSAI